MRVKELRSDEVIDADYEPECVIWTDDGGPYTYYTSVDEWVESMLEDKEVWYGTHNDEAYIAEAASDLRKRLRVKLRWYQKTDCYTYKASGATFFVSPLYIDVETNDWYYPNEVEVLESSI